MGEREIAQAAEAIERLRKLRVRPGPPREAGAAIEPVRLELGKRVRQIGGMVEAWRAVVPDALRDRTAVGGFSRGVLTIDVPDTGTRYRVQQWLRAGGRTMLIGCAPATVRRIEVRVGS